MLEQPQQTDEQREAFETEMRTALAAVGIAEPEWQDLAVIMTKFRLSLAGVGRAESPDMRARMLERSCESLAELLGWCMRDKDEAFSLRMVVAAEKAQELTEQHALRIMREKVLTQMPVPSQGLS